MAGLKIDQDQYIVCTDNFDTEQWCFFQERLTTSGRVFKQLSFKYNIELIRDSRWPTRGVIFKRFFTEIRVRLILNSHYLDELSGAYGKEFYELIVTHTPTYFSRLFLKKIKLPCIKSYEWFQIENEIFLKMTLELLFKDLRL
ncbi:MAG: hypothetical protein NTV43_13195 [Methylococcales bacterium]|nr:hypothetical protein [Methylococcales bacterium]